MKAADKGERAGECNRTACTARPANWFSHVMQAWYCQPCALQINAACPIPANKLVRDERINPRDYAR